MPKTSISLLAVAAAAPAFAQSNPTQPTTDAAGDTIVVTATRSGDAIPTDVLGASVTVLDAAALDQRQTRVVSDILRDVPGVAVSRTGAIGGLTQVRLRGAESNHTLVLIDGIEASDPFSGEFDFATLIADEDARIEVLRGQQSALYGSDAIGGVINYITLTGAEAPGIRLRAEGGSMGTFNTAARAAGVSGDIDYALSASTLHTHGYSTAPGGHRDVGSDNAGASAKASWTPNEVFKLTAVGRYSYTDADSNDPDNDFASPTYGRTIDSPGVRFRNKVFYGLLRGQLNLLDGRFANVVSAQYVDSRRTDFDIPEPYSPPAGQPIVKAGGDRGRRVKGSYEGSFHFGSDRVRQSLTAAIDYERESERTTRSTYGAFTGRRHTSNTGVVGEYELVADDRLGIGASLRHDYNSRFADDTTYRVQASYRFDEGTRIHAAAGSGVKVPTFSELFDLFDGHFIGNPDLKPEKSTGWETGVEQRFADGRFTIGATYFHNRLKNEITTIYDASFVASPINLPGRTRQHGIEAAAAARFGNGWRIDASYTWLHAPQDRSVTFDPVTFAGGTFTGQAIRRARTIASASLDWSPKTLPFSATATLRYNGRQNDLFFGYFPGLLVKLRSFTLVNLAATYRIGNHVELFGRVEDLLDRNYVEVYGFATPGRTATGGVRLRF